MVIPPLTPDPVLFFCEAYCYLSEHGYADEIRWAETLPPLEQQTPETFFAEYVWVVLNAGMREQVARKIYDQFMIARDPAVIHHRGRRAAVERALAHAEEWFAALLAAEDKLGSLERLPWIGPVTKYHLARNLGIDVVKPDRHLKRLAARFGYETPDALCRAIQAEAGAPPGPALRLGTIDLVLWRYCNLLGSDGRS
jgi:AraC-like DNA-binding protein